MVNLQTRKPVDRLTLGDFAAYPVWGYATDEEGVEGQDETWERPVPAAVVPKRSYTHVAASNNVLGTFFALFMIQEGS
jgi:hypothetical protein